MHMREGQDLARVFGTAPLHEAHRHTLASEAFDGPDHLGMPECLGNAADLERELPFIDARRTVDRQDQLQSDGLLSFGLQWLVAKGRSYCHGRKCQGFAAPVHGLNFNSKRAATLCHVAGDTSLPNWPAIRTFGEHGKLFPYALANAY